MGTLIKNIFSTLFFSYKNIFHFIFSKILISISSYLVAFLYSFIFLFISFLIIYFSGLELKNFFLGGSYLTQDFLNNKISFIITIFFFSLFIIFFSIGINYKRILLAKLNFGYIKRERLDFQKNEYFNFKLIKKYYLLSLVFLLIFFILTFIFFALVGILIAFFGGIQNLTILLSTSGLNSFSILSFVLFIIYVLLFLYLSFRFYFSYFILLENQDFSIKKILKKSFKKTKGIKKILYFIGIIILYFLLIFPFSYVSQYFDYKKDTLLNYIELKNKSQFSKLNQKDYYNFEGLKTLYGDYSNKELLEIYNKTNTIQIIILIFYFLFIYGIFDIFISVYYKKIIK